MNRHRRLLVAAAAAVAVAAATVTAVAAHRRTTAARPDRRGAGRHGGPDHRTQTARPRATPPPPLRSRPRRPRPHQAQAVPVYYVGGPPAGPRLFREFHRMVLPDDRAVTAKAALVAAVGSTALDPDYWSPWKATNVVVGAVARAGDTVTVDLGGTLHDRPAGMSKAEAGIAVEQLVHTVQAVYQEHVPVQLLLEGHHTDTVLGVPTAEPLAAGDPMRVQAPVWIIGPQDGDEVPSPFTVTGRGAFFEANVSWQLLVGDRVVDEGFATAQECCTLAPYSFEVDAAPGDYVLRVYDADMSGGEGAGEAQDTKRVTVR